MKRICFVVLFSLTLSAALAQYKTCRALGDKAFEDKNYYEAAYYYGRAIGERAKIAPGLEMPFNTKFRSLKKISPADSAYAVFRLAESYRLFEDYREAEIYYKRILSAGHENEYPLARLWYGVCLRTDGKFDEAIAQLEQFRKTYNSDAALNTIAAHEIADCAFAKAQYRQGPLANITKVPGPLNSGDGNYAMSRYHAGFLFTSSRKTGDSKRNVNRIYYAGLSDTLAPQMINFKNAEQEKIDEYGTPSSDAEGKRIYFTGWSKQGPNTITRIYYSEWENDAWSAPQILNSQVNEDGYNSRQPFVAADGKTLFFASDKPGGMGGDDIWMSSLGGDGQPVNSVNLGGTVNTPSDEQAPFYDAAGKRLIYSSKGFTGLGGFDLFESFGEGTSWSAPRNLGFPINSTKDDLYYLDDSEDPSVFYLSSDRESDCCFSIFMGKMNRYILSGVVIDCKTNQPLTGVTVTYVDSLSSQREQAVSDNMGKYRFIAKAGIQGKLVFEKENYQPKTVGLPNISELQSDTLFASGDCLESLRPGRTFILKRVLFDFNSYALTATARNTLDTLAGILASDTTLKIRLSANTDSLGNTAYNLALSEKRAESCINYFAGKGIDADRFVVKAYGESKPIAPNSLPDGRDNPEGRHLNRRVEFTILEPGDEQ